MMAYVMVDISKFKGFPSETVKVHNNIDRINSDLAAISRALDWDVSSCADIDRTLAQIHDRLERYSQVVQKMAKFLDYAMQEYSQLDQNTMQVINAIPEGSVVTPKNNKILDTIFKWFGAAAQVTAIKMVKYFMRNVVLNEIARMVGKMPIVKGSKVVAGFINNFVKTKPIDQVIKMIGNAKQLGTNTAAFMGKASKILLKSLPGATLVSGLVESGLGIAKGIIEHRPVEEIFAGVPYDLVKGCITGAATIGVAALIVATLPVSGTAALIGGAVVVTLGASALESAPWFKDHLGREKFVKSVSSGIKSAEASAAQWRDDIHTAVSAPQILGDFVPVA